MILPVGLAVTSDSDVNAIWLIVGVLAIIALLIFIIKR